MNNNVEPNPPAILLIQLINCWFSDNPSASTESFNAERPIKRSANPTKNSPSAFS